MKVVQEKNNMHFDDLEVTRMYFRITGKTKKLKNEDSPKPLRKCSSCNSLHTIQDGCHSHNFSPLSLICYSVVSRDTTTLYKLLKAYPQSVNQLTQDGVSLLHVAALDGNIDIMKILIEFHADVNKKDVNGVSVLEYAVTSGQFDASQYLIKCGADMKKIKDGLVL